MTFRFIPHVESHHRFITELQGLLETTRKKGYSYVIKLGIAADYTICLCNTLLTENLEVECNESADLHVSTYKTTGIPSLHGPRAIQKAIWLMTLVGKIHEPFNLEELSKIPWIQDILNDPWAIGNNHYVLALNSFHLQSR
jgi:hypothetical protein